MKSGRPRPTIPPKPNLQASEKKNEMGKVKWFVRKFSGQESEAAPASGPGASKAASEATASLDSTPQRHSASEPQSHPVTRGQESEHHQRTHTPAHQPGSRSAPDGSEEDVPVCAAVDNSQSPAAPPTVHRGVPQHCICYQNRPGMQLMWVPVPESAEVEDSKETLRTGSFPPSTIAPPLPDLPLQAVQITAVPNSTRMEEEPAYEMLTDDPYYVTVLKESVRPRGPGSDEMPTPLTAQTRVSRLSGRRAAPPPPPPPPSTPRPITHSIPRPLPPPPVAYLSCLPKVFVLPPVQSELPSLHADAYEWDDSDVPLNTEEGEPKYDTARPRRISSDWEPQRQDGPLYQIYQAKAIVEAIHAQSVFERASRTSVDLQVRVGGGGALLPEALHMTGRGPGEVALWQDLPVVRDGGFLERLGREELQRQESLFEVLTSEASYLRSLQVLVDHFLMSRFLVDTLLVYDKRTLFSNILSVRAVSERFFNDLLERVDESIMITDVCDIIHQHALENFTVYIDYIRNQGYQEKAYSSLIKLAQPLLLKWERNRAFAVEMRRLEESPLCRRLPFSSFLLLPFQRITRIKILVQNILKRTPEGSTEERTASLALASVSEIIKESNTQVGQMRQMEELIHVTNTLKFDKLKAIPLISKSRRLEKRGELQELCKSGSLLSTRPKLTPTYLYLFNDLLIITYKKSPERYVVTDHAHRSLVQVRPALESAELGSRFEHSFSLLLLENHRGQSSERLLKAPSESDMHRWMAAFPSLGDTNKEEVIYEDWDCPQAQCVEPYSAQQADELTLEPADIINVLQKTHEGWYKGVRLSDREKGWFPAGNVMEITNEHMRRRNLREQFRINQATR